MAIVMIALPILPGREDQVLAFGERLDAAGLRERYEELNRLAGITRHLEVVQAAPGGGSLRLVLFETETPERIARPIGDDEYDRWWRTEVIETHGFDPAGGERPPMQPGWDWTA